ncbi:MAG TPA: dipeptide epimerase [Parafilimonas sp.]|nr:dipeptide epimerase [Parafilimonas sp.]
MKIKSIKAFKKNLKLQKPYTIARETITNVENVFFEIKLANGITGIGAANPDPDVVGENLSQTLENLHSEFLEYFIGKDIRHFQQLIYTARTNFKIFPGTQACIDIALHDAFCQYLGVSVLDFYGRHHEKMLTSVTIGIKNVEETIKEADEYFEKGFRILKVKTGSHAELDAERIIKLNERFGDHFVIRVDANTGYTINELKLFLALTKDSKIELIEQPLPPSADKDLSQLSQETRQKLAADESLKNAKAGLELAKQNLYGIFNIKLMKCGGIKAALEIANIARAGSIDVFWGCNDESITSITAALHAAFATPHTKYIDLDGSFDLAEDVVEGGFTVKDGYMYVNNKPGLGLKLV